MYAGGSIDKAGDASRTETWYHKSNVMKSEGNSGGGVHIGGPKKEGGGFKEGSGTLSDTARLDNMTPRELNNLTPEQIKQALPDGWTYSGSFDGRFIHIKDSNGNYRIRIDPPDKITNYPHMHILDGDGNPLDINGNIVSPNSPDGYIPR